MYEDLRVKPTALLLGLSIKTYTDVILTHQTKLVDIITYRPNL